MSKTNFNSILADCAKNIEIMKNETHYHYESLDDYNSTLEKELKDFSISITDRKEINVIIYNSKNTDGTFSAAIVYHYINSNANKPNIDLIRLGEGEQNLLKNINKLKDKNVIILDLQYENSVYKQLGDVCNKVYGIDNHRQPTILPDNVKVISSEGGHASCALVWKVFYPKKKVPDTVKLADLGDTKKRMKKMAYANFFTSAITYRFTASPYVGSKQWDSGVPLTKIWDIIESDNTVMWRIIGKYMGDSIENLKEQVARNAVIKKFQGYTVAVLNYLDPVLYKRVAKQIITNFKKKNKHIDFAVLWGWEHSGNRYKIALTCEHSHACKVNLPLLARILGKLGKARGHGGGVGYVGNFYWPRNKQYDIWDLFEKNYLTAQDRKKLIKK